MAVQLRGLLTQGLNVAKKGLNFSKALPMPLKLAVGSLLFAGGIVGSALITADRFERKMDNQQETYEAQVKELNQQLQALQQPKEEAGFKYVPPTVGKNGIASSDTIYYPGTDKVKNIVYSGSHGNIKHQTNFDEDGKMTDFIVRDGDLIRSYDANGGRNYVQIKIDGGYQYYDDRHMVEYKMKADGSSIEIDRPAEVSQLISKREYDKNGKLLQKKCYEACSSTEYNGIYPNVSYRTLNEDAILKFTVTPRYNSQGDLIKRDTIWNNQ